MDKIELDIIALSHSVTKSHNYAVVLGELDGSRRLPIVIGGYEAQAIAVALEKMIPNRPLTHDLFKNTLETFDVSLKEVVINNLLDGIFYAQLVCTDGKNEMVIDSRTSDAIAMAIRFSVPIFTYEKILGEAGVEMEGDEGELESKPKKQKKAKSYEDYTTDQLDALLQKLIEEEDYEKAAKVRDIINKRSEN